MTTKPTYPNADDDEMPAQIDFSKGVRGKLFRTNARLLLPVHMDADIANAPTRSAQRDGVEISAFVAKLLEEHRGAANEETNRA